MSVLDLIEDLKVKRSGTTKQGVYAALRLLRKAEVVVLHKGQVSLNIRWLNSTAEYFTRAQYFYLQDAGKSGHFLNLKQGEKIRYFFQSPAVTDAFCIHVIYLLIDLTGADFFGYNPHDWFLIGRRQSERDMMDYVVKKGRLYLMTVAGQSFLDKFVAGEFNGNQTQYYMSDKVLFEKNNYYLNIIGDFLIEVLIDQRSADNIGRLYGNTSSFSEDVTKQLKGIVESQGRSRLTITRNLKKADRLRRSLAKHFYISKGRLKKG